MSNNSVDNPDNKLVHIRNKTSCEVDLGKSIRLTGAHDRPAIFIENNDDDYNDSTALLNS